jgi:2-methylisocitrate lyase-like PEP mutase family enzyme
MVDADTGFGNAIVRTIKVLERAGADAIQIEDQVFPKLRPLRRQGGDPLSRDGRQGEGRGRRRSDGDLPIVARTDAIATDGYGPSRAPTPIVKRGPM